MRTNNLFQDLLEIITPSSESATDEEWELTLRFARQYGEEDLAEVILANTSESTEPWKVGSLIDHLVWNISDQSVTRLMRSLESWICSNDRRKVSYALAQDYLFPFCTPEQMSQALVQVKDKWPEFGARCDELSKRRERVN